MTITAQLHVKFEPPALLLNELQDVSLAFVEGDGSIRELAIDAIESVTRAPWIKAIQIQPDTLATVESLKIDESPEMAPELVRRTYRFGIRVRNGKAERYRGTLSIQTSFAPILNPSSVPLEIQVVERVSILPKQLTITTTKNDDKNLGRVVVLQRQGSDNVEVAAFDSELLDVIAIGEQGTKSSVFDVLAKVRNPNVGETKVLFRIGTKETRELTVRLQPQPEAP